MGCASLTVAYDRLQLNMSTFPMRNIILGHHGTGTLIDQPISNYFKNYIAQYTINSFICVLRFFKRIYSCVLKCVPVLCLVFLYIFVPKLHFQFLHLKRAHKSQGNIYVVP